ncbi:MAG TPA: acetate--CoA ligase family protein [Steroidobacteraceae bacterium]|nr:acetate--CoA ligase family protein [Steroidobacteraceae bacterium]
MAELSALLSPRSIAVVGASSDTTILRGRTLKVMLRHAYEGRIYPVSRSQTEVQGLRAFPSVAELPERVDLALLIIPAKFVVAELERCGRAGIKAALIITSGFAEQSGTDGAQLQNRVREVARQYNMIVCGPNTEGFANTHAALCATFSPVVDGLSTPLVPSHRTQGHVAVIGQSGGMGFAFFDRGRPKEIPFSYIVTTGNEACLEVFDVVDYLLDEGRTDIFLLFLENIKSAATFKRAADKALRAGKPIIVTKIGHSEPGQRATASHTAALAGSYQTYQAMFHRYGVIEGADIEEMVDLAAAFSLYRERLPQGKRIGIGTASGGGGGWLADACIAAGLQVPTLDDATRKLIDAHLPPYGTSQNPVDGTAQAIRDIGYGELARLISLSNNVDAVAMVTSTRSSEVFERERENLQRISSAATKPIFMWSYTNPCDETIRIMSETGYPLFTNMRNCARAIAMLAEYRARRERYLHAGESHMEVIEERSARARALLNDKVLCEYQLTPLLNEYGIHPIEGQLASSVEMAAAIARTMPHALALKIQSPDILHKTDIGAVALDIRGTDAVRRIYSQLIGNMQLLAPDANVHGILVQRMASPGIEMIVGIRRDGLFGPMLMIGFGGVQVEVLRDVVLSPVPISAADAHELLDRLKSRALLSGVRGASAADIPALADLIVRLSTLAFELSDEIEELELNPVIVHEAGQGISIVDVLAITRVHAS